MFEAGCVPSAAAPYGTHESVPRLHDGGERQGPQVLKPDLEPLRASDGIIFTNRPADTSRLPRIC
jgi:hypothetical protein